MSNDILMQVIAAITSFQVGGVSIMEFASAVVTFVGGASILGAVIARWTPTPKDDQFFGKLYEVIHGINNKGILKVSLNVSKENKTEQK